MSESFADLFEESLQTIEMAPGSIVTGTVVDIDDDWVVVHGCGGVGLSAIMIGKALGAKIIAIDINEATLALAKQLGADHSINSQFDLFCLLN